MPKFKFTCDHSESLGRELINTQEFTAVTINDVLENFEMFLRGAGYTIDGVIDIVPHDDEWKPEPNFSGLGLYDDQDILSSKSKHYFDTERNK